MILRLCTLESAWSGKQEQGIYAAIGKGKMPFIDARDIAAVAAEVLLHPDGHKEKIYVLTGREAVGYSALTKAISVAIGSDVTYHALSMDEMRTRMEKQGMEKSRIDSFLALAAYQKAGGSTERVSDSIQETLKIWFPLQIILKKITLHPALLSGIP